MVIKVYPNGFKEKSKGNVSVILYNESDADVSLRYQVELKNVKSCTQRISFKVNLAQ